MERALIRGNDPWHHVLTLRLPKINLRSNDAASISAARRIVFPSMTQVFSIVHIEGYEDGAIDGATPMHVRRGRE
jgi:hypothetical protein